MNNCLLKLSKNDFTIMSDQRRLRSRAWCFTINNFSEEEKNKVEEIICMGSEYGIAEIEHSDENEGTPHIQGYFKFHDQRTFLTIKRMIPRAHIEKANGSWQENFIYCSKENTVFAIKGHTVEEARQNVGKSNFEMMYEDMKILDPQTFSQKYPKEWYLRRTLVERIMIDSAMAHVNDFNGNLTDKNLWIWGEPGVGKSRWAAAQGSYSEIFKKNFNKWWDGYNLLLTKIVILEDYPCLPQGNVLVQHMKLWGDRYPFEAECKGSHMMVEPKRFFLIITSNYPIDACFEQEEDKTAIHRRFKEIEMKRGDLMAQCVTMIDRSLISN